MDQQDRDRQVRMVQVWKAHADAQPDQDYADLTQAWDESTDDGLSGA